MFGIGLKKFQVKLDRPGSLHLHIAETEKYQISELTIEGELNGSDLFLLRDMAGYSLTGSSSPGCLKRLDLRNARFVPGGSSYARSNDGDCFITETDSIPVRAFRKCSKLKVVILPEGVKSLGAHAFERCSSLSSVTLPEGLETIGRRTFRKCVELKAVTMPSTLLSIDHEAFSEDANVKKIYVAAATPPAVCIDSFYDVPIFELKLYVPAASANDYRLHPSWKKFKNIKNL